MEKGAPRKINRRGHAPVLLDEVIEALTLKAGDIVVDGTFGGGGYARAALETDDITLYGIDRDPAAMARGAALRAEVGARFTMLEGCFGDMEALLKDAGVYATGVTDAIGAIDATDATDAADATDAIDAIGATDATGAIGAIDAIVLDVGVSSFQLDEAERGFSFSADGPLDMRMSQAGESAADVVNTYAEEEIADILYRLGEEHKSRYVARAIVLARADAPFETTLQLAEVIRGAIRVPHKRGKKFTHPATKSFQALRIHVNDELGELERALNVAEKLLKSGGRLVVVSFHSLEDRIVKKFMIARAGLEAGPSRHLPHVVSAEKAPTFTLPRKSAIKPSVDECAQNPRARSARLRSAIRTDAPVGAIS